MNLHLNKIFLFLFVFSCVYLLNLIVKVVVSVLKTPPQQLKYSKIDKILNYFTITYLLTYLI
jgi:hypothetical protein